MFAAIPRIELSLTPFLNFLQRLLDCATRFVFEFGIANQPLIEGFFRPEEVDDPSTTTQEEDSRRWIVGYKLTFIEDHTNPSRALW